MRMIGVWQEDQMQPQTKIVHLRFNAWIPLRNFSRRKWFIQKSRIEIPESRMSTGTSSLKF